eukprot:Gb_20109 [translate_table: standard]
MGNGLEPGMSERRNSINVVGVARDGNDSSLSASNMPNQAINDDKVSWKSSLKPSEAAKFATMAKTWWDHEGPYKPLHLMNPVRISSIRYALCRHFGKDPSNARPFEGLRIIDVSYGGEIEHHNSNGREMG